MESPFVHFLGNTISYREKKISKDKCYKEECKKISKQVAGDEENKKSREFLEEFLWENEGEDIFYHREEENFSGIVRKMRKIQGNKKHPHFESIFYRILMIISFRIQAW